MTGFALIIRTGNLRGNEKIYWVYIGQITNGIAFALLTTTTFPEIVDSVERTDMYPSYNKEDSNLYISGFYVFLQSIATALGTFFGSFAADVIGYNWAFICAGLAMILFAVVYAIVVGPGEHMSDEETVVKSKEEPATFANEDVELSQSEQNVNSKLPRNS
jgi:MFS family permease